MTIIYHCPKCGLEWKMDDGIVLITTRESECDGCYMGGNHYFGY